MSSSRANWRTCRSSPTIDRRSASMSGWNPSCVHPTGRSSRIRATSARRYPSCAVPSGPWPARRKAAATVEKSKRKLAKIHARVRRLRKEHHHAVALRLVRRYGSIAAERLDIRGMLESGRLSRSIADAGWDGFLRTLGCKAESAGIPYVAVDPRGTSQRCSGCGATVPKALRDRWHDCPGCGLSLHRDENSAREILRLGLLARTGPVGHNVGR